MVLCSLILLSSATNVHASTGMSASKVPITAPAAVPKISQQTPSGQFALFDITKYEGEIAPRFEVLSRTYEDIWVEDNKIYFWAYAIPWEPAKITIKLKVEETIDGEYKTIINTSETVDADELELIRTIPYGKNRYFKVTINYIVGPDTPTVTKYFYT